MENIVNTFKLNIDWRLINLISQIDRFDASWSALAKREGQSLKQLKYLAIVRSVGAAARIEGSKMTDDEIGVLLSKSDMSKIVDEDALEVVGYYETMDIISRSYADNWISEIGFKKLHDILMRYSAKDEWHKGDFKQLRNDVETKLPDGRKQIIFQTSTPGYPTQNAIQQLIAWYTNDNLTHPLVKCSLFAYVFIGIHPFQEGNWRLNWLISSLLMLKNGYEWIQFASIENEIESRKSEYYRILRGCQSRKPNEDVSDWVIYYLEALNNMQLHLKKSLETKGVENQLSPREKAILTFIGNHAGCKSGEIAKKLGIPSPTVKRLLPDLIDKQLITKYGTGPGTNYTTK